MVDLNKLCEAQFSQSISTRAWSDAAGGLVAGRAAGRMQTRICELSNTGMITSYYVTCRARRARPASATAADVAEVHAKHTLPLRFVEAAHDGPVRKGVCNRTVVCGLRVGARAGVLRVHV